MRAMARVWAKASKDPGNRSQDEVPKESISRAGRIRKIKDISAYYYGTSRTSSSRATTVKATTSNLETSKKKDETESVAMEAEVAPVETVEETPKPESVKDSKARVNPDLLQKVLSESVEEWFSFSEVSKSNKGKPYKKRKIVLPPMNESDFCFELTQTTDTENKPEDENSKIDSTPNEETEVEVPQLEEGEKEDRALEINRNEKVRKAVIKKKRRTMNKSASLRMVDKNVENEEKEKKEDERVEEKDSGLMPSSSKTDGVNEAQKEISEARKEISEVQKEISEFKKEFSETKKEFSETKKEFSETKKEVSETKKEVSETKKEVSETKKEISETKKEVSETKKEFSETKKEVSETKKEVSETKKEISETVKEIRVFVKKLNEIIKKIRETVKEATTGKRKNKSYRNFFALILYGDETNGEAEPDMMTVSEQQTSSGQQAKAVIKTLNLETADLKEFEVELEDFSKLPKDSPIFECMSGIERLLKTGATESTPQESQNGESLSVFPKSYKETEKRNAEMSAALPSVHKKMNLKAQERLYKLNKDIMQKYKRKGKGRKNEEAQAVKENTIEEEKVDETKEKQAGEKEEEQAGETKEKQGDEKKEEQAGETKEKQGDEKEEERREKAKKFKKTDSKEMIDEAQPKKKPKKNENVHEDTEKEEINEPIEEKGETELEKPEMKEITHPTCTKRTKLTTHKRMNKGKVKKMSALKCKKRKKLGQVRTRVKLEKLFSYVNAMKRKSGYRSSTDSAESLNSSYEEQTPKGSESNQESRVEKTAVEETVGRRKSRREIKLTPKLVDMIANSNKRTKRSPSIREDSMDDSDYEYPNLLKKVVSGRGLPGGVESPHSSSAIENYSGSKKKVNSGFEGNWKPGDMVWARFAGSPFWPSLVVGDPFSNGAYTKVKHLGRLLKPFVHLQFFADSGKRAWVPEHYCMSFNGLDEFERKKSNLPKINSFTQRNDLLYQKAFFPRKQIEMSWLVAVIEGETVLKKSTDERLEYMKVKYPLVKYVPSATNGQPCEAETVTNGTASDETTSGEVASHSHKTKRRKARSSSAVETFDQPDYERPSTSREPPTETVETFECVGPSGLQDNADGGERSAPKITLKLVRKPKKNEKRQWSKSSDNIEGPSAKKPKKHVSGTLKKKAKAGLKLGKQKKKVGGKKKEVCEVCLRVLGRRKVIKCNEVCTGVIRRGSRKKTGVKVGRLEEGAAPALKKRNRRQKFSSTRENKWKEKLRSIFDFYKEYGGFNQDGMDARGVFPLSISV